MSCIIIDHSFDEVSKLILAAVKERRPASFIRFNDGEARFIGKTEYYPSAVLIAMIRRHYGDNVLSDAELNSLGNRVMEAVRNSDITALPPANWPQDFARAREIVSTQLADMTLNSTHVDFHQRMFESPFFLNLFALGAPVSAITCRDVTHYIKDVYAGEFEEVYMVPEQADGSYNGKIAKHYPTYCDWLCGVIAGVAKGKVFLVGAGVCGKIYCEAIRLAGGVAIDIGSIFDLWAGRLSRDYMSAKGIRSYYLSQLSEFHLTPAVLRATSEIYTSEGNYSVAIRILRYASDFFSNEADFFLRLIKTLIRSANEEAALELAKTNAPRLSAPELLLIARMFKDTMLRHEAPAFFQTAFDKDPFFSPVLTELCGLIVGTKDLPHSTRQKVLTAATIVAADGPHTLIFQLARVLGSSGDLTNALRYSQRAIDRFSSDANYVSHHAAWLRSKGKVEEATIYDQKLAALTHQ